MSESKFLLDEHIAPAVAVQLRNRGIDCITVREAGRLGLADESHLEWAALQGRIIVSFDDDYFPLARAFSGHGGLIHCTPHTRDIGPIVRALTVFAEQHDADEAANRVWYI